MSLLFGLCLPFWWNRLRALPGAPIHLSSPYVSPPPPRKLRAKKHSHCVLFLKTGIFSFLEAQLPFLKTRSPFKGTINYLNLVQSLKLKSKKGWPLSFTSRSISAVQEVPSSYNTLGLLAAVTTRQSSSLWPGCTSGGLFINRFLLFTVPRIATAFCFSVILSFISSSPKLRVMC